MRRSSPLCEPRTPSNLAVPWLRTCGPPAPTRSDCSRHSPGRAPWNLKPGSSPGDHFSITYGFSSPHSFDPRDHVAVKKPDGTFAWRDVLLGPSGSTDVEVM